MNELALFAGAAGGILGGHLLGWKTVCAVEIEDYPQRVLLQRQADGILPRFPIWDDITTFDGTPWKGRCDIITGGFPCQDISAAGKGAGIDGERSGLWSEMFRVVCEVGPKFIFVENSPMLTIRGLHKVLGDLASVGYDARWCVLGADTCGAPHKRDRIWILAHTNKTFITGQRGTKRVQKKNTEFDSTNQITWWNEDPADLPDTAAIGLQRGDHKRISGKSFTKRIQSQFAGINSVQNTRPTQPRLGRVAHGVAHRVDRLKAIGNGQVPAVAAIAFIILSEGLI